jgi:hypothetical protein
MTQWKIGYNNVCLIHLLSRRRQQRRYGPSDIVIGDHNSLQLVKKKRVSQQKVNSKIVYYLRKRRPALRTVQQSSCLPKLC